MKVGLALSGGGAKGSFQQGVLDVFEEEGLFSYVKQISGVSIGALHAVCVAANKLDYSRGIWETVDKKEAFDDGQTLLERLKANEYDVLNKGLFPIRKLDQLLDEFLDLDTLRLDVYVGATKISLKNPTFSSIFNYNLQHIKRGELPIEYIHLNELPVRLIKKILLASTAIPVVFKPVQVGETIYVDGGVFNNTPIKPLLDSKMDKIIVIDLFRFNLRRKPKIEAVPIYYIYPHQYLGGVLNFNPDQAQLNIAYGREVALQKLPEIRRFLELT